MSESFGEALRKGREQAGIELRQLAETTKIQTRYLEALETENWRALPPGVIGRGFVRVVARELRLPVTELLERYQAARGREDSEPDRHLPETDWKVDLKEGHNARPWLWALAAAAVLFWLLWLWSPWKPRNAPPGDTEATAARSGEESTTPPAAAEALPRPPADAPVGSAGSSKADAPAAPPMQIEIVALDKVWVQVAADGGQGKSRVLHKGERLAQEGRSAIDVKLGNAAAARLYWNGEALRAPGGASQVVTLHFPRDAESLKP